MSVWRYLNPEECRASNLRWQRANREKHYALNKINEKKYPLRNRIKLQNRRNRKVGTFKAQDVRDIFSRQDGLCANPKCCADLNIEGYHIDHRIPLSRGGPNIRENIQLLCARCNLVKGNQTPEECGY